MGEHAEAVAGDPRLELRGAVVAARFDGGDHRRRAEAGVGEALFGDAAGGSEQHPELALAALHRDAALGVGASAASLGERD